MFPLVHKTLKRIFKAVEIGDQMALMKELKEKKQQQELSVRELVQLQSRKQVLVTICCTLHHNDESPMVIVYL
jgi:hypothetical protein